MNKKYLLGASALACASMFAVGANAQSEIQETAPLTVITEDDLDVTEVEAVVIQANRRDEFIQEVPVAVTVFTPKTRDDLGVISIFDITRATPSFEYSTAIDRAFIRGIGRNTNAPGTQAGVALYIDGVYTPSTYGLDRPVIMSGNTEIDAGPQGTLFGRNAIGGVIQQNTAHATDEFETRVDLRYQDHNRIDTAFTVGGPVNENLRILVGADYRHQTNGYFYNTYLNEEVGGPTEEYLLLAVADYRIGDNFEGFVKVEANGYERYLSQFSQYGSTFTNRSPYFNDTTYTNFVSVTQNFNCAIADPSTGRALMNCPANVAQAVEYYDPADIRAQDPYLVYNDYRTVFKSDGNGTIVTQNTWHLPMFDVKYIGGYTQYIYDNTQDYDNTARGVFDVDPDGPAGLMPAVSIYPTIYHYYEDRAWYSHEFNFSSVGDGPVRWIYGLYYYYDDFLNDTWINAPGQEELNTVAGVDNSRLDYYSTHGRAITETYATFGQVDWEINDRWALTAGLRWNRDEVQTEESDHYYSWVPGVTAFYNPATQQYGPASDYSLLFVPGSCTPAGVPPITDSGATCTYDPATNTREIGNSWEGWGGVFNVSFTPNDRTLLYAKYSRGYKAGGVAISGAMSVQPVLEPETLNAYEVGFKYQAGRTLTFNTAAFYYDYHDYQDFGSIPNVYGGNNTLVSVGFNIPRARNVGVEVTGRWHPTRQFTLTFSGNLMNAEVTDGGDVNLVDTLDPLASGQSIIRYQDGSTTTLNYTPEPCGTPIVSGGQTFQPQCINGNALKGSSPWKLWISPQYRFDFDSGSLDLIANYSMRAGNVSYYTNDPIYVAPDYDSIDLRAIWTADQGDYRIIAFVNNVTDNVGTEFVLAGRTNTFENYVQNVFTIPRTWGVEFQKTF